MTLPHPNTLQGLIAGERELPLPASESVEVLLNLHATLALEQTKLSPQEMEFLCAHGFSAVVYRHLYDRAAKEASDETSKQLSNFLRANDLSRLADEVAGRGSKPARVSAYVPCYNGSQTLSETISALRNQSYPIEEIIVVDDASTDNSAVLAAELGARVVTHDKNLGLGAARNSGIAAAQGEYIVGVDSDVVAHPFWVERLLQTLQNRTFAAAGGRLIERHAVLPPDAWRARIMRQHHGVKAVENQTIYGCNSAGLAADLRRCGYSAAYKQAFDDVDFTRRFIGMGGTAHYIPDALCYHTRKDSLRSALRSAYNWRSPSFDERGAMRETGALVGKWSYTVRGDIAELSALQAEGRTNLTAITFLHLLFSIERDLIRFSIDDAAQKSAFYRLGLFLLIRSVLLIPALGPNSQRAALELLGCAEKDSIAAEALVRAQESMGKNPAQAVAEKFPNVAENLGRILLVGLAEFPAILNFGKRIYDAIESGAPALLAPQSESRIITAPPGFSPDLKNGISDCVFGAGLTPFEWIEGLSGASGKCTIDAQRCPEHIAVYWCLRLLSARDNRKIAIVTAAPPTALMKKLLDNYPASIESVPAAVTEAVPR